MHTLSVALTLLVAALHAYFMLLEMVYWDKPKGLKAFGLTQEFATASKTLAANQGLYNGFLAAGLIWSCFPTPDLRVRCFFLVCVLVAGVYGAATVGRKILFVQAVPAAVALVVTLMA